MKRSLISLFTLCGALSLSACQVEDPIDQPGGPVAGAEPVAGTGLVAGTENPPRCGEPDAEPCEPVGGDDVPPVGGDDVPPVGGDDVPPVGGDDVPPVGGDDVPPVGGDDPLPVGCDTPNPSLTCRTEGCAEGFTCQPSDADLCVPSSCFCDEEFGGWVCTEDCGQAFECVPEGEVFPPCPDADRDGVCDGEDAVCEVDGVGINCRRLAPDCPRGEVPEAVDGCYTDVCLPWALCAERVNETNPPVDPPVDPVLCGGRFAEPMSCPRGTFCDFPLESMCGATDLPGVCMPIEFDLLCPDLYDPVCGCDGATYSNSCDARRVGVSVMHLGTCEPLPPVEPISCGGFRPEPVTCPVGTFCAYTLEAMCGAADAPGVCEPLDPRAICPAVVDPVCGCNGVTYNNECEARRAGTSAMSLGPCEQEPLPCGGFAGLSCPSDLICVDDPSDRCDPELGGADCPGICVAR